MTAHTPGDATERPRAPCICLRDVTRQDTCSLQRGTLSKRYALCVACTLYRVLKVKNVWGVAVQ